MSCSAHAELAIELGNFPWTLADLSALAKCPSCNTPIEPEPSDEEREKLFMDPDGEGWDPPEGVYMWRGYGFAGGGGIGIYVNCDECGFFAKEPPKAGEPLSAGCVHV